MRLDDHDLADLASCKSVDDWQILLEDAELLSVTGVGREFDEELVDCFGVGFAVNEDHSSSDRVRLLLQPLPRIVERPDGQGANLPAFR